MNDGAFSDLVDVLERSVRKFSESDLFGTKKDGQWEWITYGEFGRRVDYLRGGLASLGVTAGDTVAIIAANRVEWAIAAYATYGLGARFCPMYEHQHEDDWRYILDDSGAKVVLTSTHPIFETVRAWIDEMADLEHVATMSLPDEDELSLGHLEAVGKEQPVPNAELSGDMICGFIYTSGTTGKPKGVLLSHDNICSNLNAVSAIFPIDKRDVSVSFLPWAHSFGQTCELHMMLSRGAAMAIAESVEKLIDNFAEVRPTVLFAVPRIFIKIYDGLQKKIAEEGGVKKVLFGAALKNEARRAELSATGRKSSWADTKHNVFDKLVFSKVRERFGGRLRYAVSGGAALPTEVAEFIDHLGIFVCEGYGLTETSPIVSCNHPGARRIGSVGRPIEGVEVTIDASVAEDPESVDGEIVVRGANVMMGYHGLPDATAEVIEKNGAFRTGDLGRLDHDGYLYITGRVKEQYKLQNGKYVVPAPLEDLLQLSPFVLQAFVHGANQPYNVALLVPDRAALEGWARQNGLGGKDYSELLKEEKVRKLFTDEVANASGSFKGYERIRSFDLVEEEFSVANGLLTPKMSLKRQIAGQRFENLLNALHEAN